MSNLPTSASLCLPTLQPRPQPFWRLHSRSVATYERTRSYAVSVAPEVRSVVVAGETKAVQGREFQLTGLEFCREETEQETLFDGLTRAQNPALATYLQFQATPAIGRIEADRILEERVTDSSRKCAASDFAAAPLRRSRSSASRAARPGW
jgi:hypothetical protein